MNTFDRFKVPTTRDRYKAALNNPDASESRRLEAADNYIHALEDLVQTLRIGRAA